MKQFILSSLLALNLLPAFAASPEGTPSHRKPNILFIFTDDQALDTIRKFGNSEIETPNLDRLASRGTTFSHAYNMGSWAPAVCVASRTMLISGQNLWNAGVHSKASRYPTSKKGEKTKKKARRDPNDPPVSKMEEILATYQPAPKPPGFKPWPELMKDAGYATFFAGKWHTSFSLSGFDEKGTVRGGMAKNIRTSNRSRPKEGQEDVWKPWDKENGGYWQGGTHWSEVLANEAVGYLKSGKSGEKPFFMYVAFNSPHDPRQSPKSFVDKYPADKLSVPKPFLPEFPFAEEICGKKLRDETLAPYPRTEHAMQVHRQEYYALVTYTDEQIGRILDTLEKTGQADNTIIIFTSDHGLACGRHGLMGKGNLFEYTIRVPLILAGPGIPQGKTIDAPVYLQDVVPTALELAGAKVPAYMDFHSLLPLIRGETDKSAYPAIYAAYFDTQRAVVADGYKLLIFPYASQKVFLYNLEKDPDEIQDLSKQPEYKEVMKKLAGKLQALQKETHDPMDISGILNSI